MNIPLYLERIHYHGPLEPEVNTLRSLQRAHLFSVPFENLDIHLGRPIRLGEDALFEKIVTHHRGGFCYELNGLFACLLEQLGYSVARLDARSINDNGSWSPDFDHLTLHVRCPGEAGPGWLVDVGWGNGPLEPLRIEAGVEQSQGDRLFRLVQKGKMYALEEWIKDESDGSRWIHHYVFDLQVHRMEEYYDCCAYHQTSPESIFTRKRICSLFLPDGRITLSDLRLITTRGGVREERDLPDEAAFRQVLHDQFALDLT
ncbi:MAG TPA: arylamine N-acetyltransferase [Anaerolineaceae bacterium]